MKNQYNSSTEKHGTYTVTHISPKFEDKTQQEAELQRIARKMVESYIALQTKN